MPRRNSQLCSPLRTGDKGRRVATTRTVIVSMIIRAAPMISRGSDVAPTYRCDEASNELRVTASSPLRNQSRADLLPVDRVLEGARHGHGTVERSWESGVVGQPLGGGAGAAPLFLRPLQ